MMSLRLPCAVRQTSALLRLPRNRTDARNRTFKSKFPTTSLVEQHDRSIPLETATRELTVDSQQQPPHEYTFAERPGAKAAQVHVRLGLEDMKDADRGQQPTVWAVARAEDSSGKRTCQRCLSRVFKVQPMGSHSRRLLRNSTSLPRLRSPNVGRAINTTLYFCLHIRACFFGPCWVLFRQLRKETSCVLVESNRHLIELEEAAALSCVYKTTLLRTRSCLLV